MEHSIIMASGMGTRMQPLTLTTPKPLIPVNGKPMIETIVEGLLRRNVRDISVVVGYLSEQFEYLKGRYGIELIINPDYRSANNISSIFYAQEVLRRGDCFICEADLFIRDDSIFIPELKESCYFGKMVEGYSEDWLFELDEYEYISRVGKCGSSCYNMVGISFFKAHEAALLADYIIEAYAQRECRNLFWDDIVNAHLNELKLRIHPIDNNKIIEIDTIDELNAVNIS